MKKTQAMKMYRQLFNTTGYINGIKIGCVRWLNNPFMVIREKDDFQTISEIGYKPIKQFHTFKELVDYIYTTKSRLEIIRKDIQAESVSTSQLLELQTLIPYIEQGDVELLEWAGVPEFKE